MSKILVFQLSFVCTLLAALPIARQFPASMAEQPAPTGGMKMKSESFDRNPQWLGVNNDVARKRAGVEVRQDFGFSAATHHAGGEAAGEMGGFISPDGHAAFYGKPIEPTTLEQPLSASGRLCVGRGGTHLLLGFFNSDTVNEWRTPNTLALRLHARGDQKFFAYVEYCTSKWRAGGDTTPFPTAVDPRTGRATLVGFSCAESLTWTLNYDPQGNAGRGVVTATIGTSTAVCNLDDSHKADGATFNRFGMINVMKSADSGSEVWFDDVTINGGALEQFAADPRWDGRNHRQTTRSKIVRPWFDFGFSETHFAGGKTLGELGGQIFRGDCRYPERMACYGDRVGPLSLDKPLRALGRIAMTRGVSDSTTLFGLYNSLDSMRSNPSQSDAVPESVLGVHVEGPSRDGFRCYPVVRVTRSGGRAGRLADFSLIPPDGASHDWSLQYDPAGAAGRGQITLVFDGRSGTLDLSPGERQRGTTLDRFGIVTSWIDGNSQNVFWDDVEYTSGQE